MRKYKNCFKLNNKGASLVTVIIVIGFIGALAGAVMMTSLVNYKMKRVSVYAKDTFYSAEQVLDEINVGLQRYISDSMSASYMDILENYSDYSVEKKRALLQTNYYEKMWDRLQFGTSNQYYDVTKLDVFLKDSTRWQEDSTTGEGFGAILGADDGAGGMNNIGIMTTYDNGIVLKDLKVYYKDSRGFVSVIQTDIRLIYPEMDFASTTALPDIVSYGVIADGAMEVKGNDNLNLEGSFYCDSFLHEGSSYSTRKLVEHSGEGQFVIKHDMSLKNSSFSNNNKSTLWVEDIEAVGSDLSVLGETLVADDLNVNGKNSNIKISGIYNGYGNSISEADESSAILINGTNSKVDMSGIEKITVAGHAYVGTKTDASSKDIFTGESIAVKSNQLMYLIPGECIGVDNTINRSVYQKNPLTAEEYAVITGDPSRYTEVSMDVTVNKLGGTIREYISQINGVAQPEKIVVQTSETPLVYYYMKFDNEEVAKRYFELYYNENKDAVDHYIENYVDTIKFPTTSSIVRIKMAGNGVYGSKENDYYILPFTVEGASTALADNQMKYYKSFEALCTKLTDDYSQLKLENLALAPSRGDQVLFENLVDTDELTAYIASGGSGSRMELSQGEGRVILSKESTVTLTDLDSDVHLVITTGDVKIDMQSFEGTVLANGNVTVTEHVKSIISNPEKSNALMRYYTPIGGQNVMVAQVLRDANDYAFAIEDAEDTQRTITSMADLVVYENWKKE